MKMIIAIIRDEDYSTILEALIQREFRVTRIASTGGFFRRGSTTMMIGVSSERVDQAISLIRDNCSPASPPDTRRATLFVLPVDNFQQV
jgi:uncharacterized protein YaaQ